MFRRMNVRMRVPAAVCLAPALFLAACGGDAGDSGDETANAADQEDAGSDAEAASSDAIAEMDPVTIKWTSEGSEGGSPYLHEFADEITEKTDGKVTFEFYWTASLMPPEETLTGVGTGVADMTQLVANYFPQELPISNWQNALSSQISRSYPHGLLQGTVVSHEIFTSDPVKQELLDHNLVPLTATTTSTGRSLMCSEDVGTLSDLEGMRIRTGNINAEEIEALGGTPTHVSTPEVYQALNRGIVDCAVYPASVMDTLSLWEVAPHIVPVGLTPLASFTVVINKDVWDSFPAEVQDIFREEAVDFMVGYNGNTLEQLANIAEVGPSEHGLTLHDPTALNEVLAGGQQERLDNLAESAPASLSDPQGFIDRYTGLMEEWETVLSEDLGMPLNERTPEALMEAWKAGPEVPLDEWAELVKEATASEE